MLKITLFSPINCISPLLFPKGMDHVIKEAEWSLLNTSLQCGHTKMKLEVEGPGAADLELYFGRRGHTSIIDWIGYENL